MKNLEHLELLESEQFQWIASRKYWDIYCHQFKEVSIDDKLIYLALYLKEGGDLDFAIKEYKVGREDYILSCLPNTLYYYIDYIRTGQPADIMSYILSLYLSELQLIKILSAELQARLYCDYKRDGNNIISKFYKVRKGGCDVKSYLKIKDLSKKESLELIFKGELEDGFSVGEFNENVPLD